MTGSTETRLARLEAKVDGMQESMAQHFSSLERCLSERCVTHLGRIEALEKGAIRAGERIGKLEAENYRRKGGKTMLAAIVAAASAAGGVIVKVLAG